MCGNQLCIKLAVIKLNFTDRMDTLLFSRLFSDTSTIADNVYCILKSFYNQKLYVNSLICGRYVTNVVIQF